MSKPFAVGDRVVYVRDKVSERPGKRAKNVHPAAHGETYTYEVEKYWVVDEILPDDRILVRTRRGKRHSIPASDPKLRKAKWWEKFFLDGRFPSKNGDAPMATLSTSDSSRVAGTS